MSTQDTGQSRDGALAALREVANDPLHEHEYKLARASFAPEDYEELIALAWRHQFETDRTKFKRQFRDMEGRIRQRILNKLEIRGDS